MAKAKTGSQIVADSQERNKAAGGGRLTMNLSPEENELWSTLVARQPKGKGQQKAAFIAAVRAALKGDNEKMSKEDLLAEVARRLK